MAFSTPANQVWKLLNNFGNKQLYSNNMHANLAPDESGGWSGTFAIGSTRFRAVYKPYDIRLTSQDLKIGLSLQPQKDGCIAMAVSTHGENAPFIVTDYELLQFLSSLKSCAGEIIRDSDILVVDSKKSAEAFSQRRTSSGQNTQTSPRTETSSAQYTSRQSSTSSKAAETARPKSSSTAAAPSTQKVVYSQRAAEAAQRKNRQTREEAHVSQNVTELYGEERKSEQSKKERRRKRSQIGKALVLILMAALAILAVLWGIKTVKKLFPKSNSTGTQVNESGSRGVTVTNGLNLSLGVTQSQIERNFGTPVSQKNGVCRYESSSLTSFGMPSCVIQVEYSGSLANAITILDLEEASKVGAIENFAPSFNAETSVYELQEQVGTAPSMIRVYSNDSVQVTEYHFGHVDPKANFSPEWKGELVCTQRSDGSYQTFYGVTFDGQDPLYYNTLEEGTRMASIYSSFDSYLADYYEFHKCLLMQNHYSRGDMQQIVSGMERVSGGETEIYRANSSCLLEDGLTPAWNYTIGIGANGKFMYFFGVNTRNWKKQDTLKGIDLKGIDVGMNWNDLLASVGMIPNMVYVDYSYITLGYGAYREDAQYLSEQFELMAVVDLSTWTVETVYDNSERTIVLE